LSLPFSNSNFFRSSSFNVTLSPLSTYYFLTLPRIMEDGSLAFQLRPGVFGTDALRVDMHTTDILTGVAQDTSELINISIQQVALAI